MKLIDLRAAAKRILGRATEKTEALRAKERANIESAAREKSHLADGYWKERHASEALQAAARGVFDALEGIDEGEGKR